MLQSRQKPYLMSKHLQNIMKYLQ